jgi:general secretion pathway protein A
MYAQHFGLEHAPFSIAPDPRYLYLSEQHREALAHLLYGLDGGGGFVLLTGEIGAGKTTVVRCFLEQVPAHCRVAYVFNPKLTVDELLEVVCEEFGVAAPAGQGGARPTLKHRIDALNRFLLDEHAAGRNGVLVIDEAQQLSAEVLEQLRLLTNLETRERKLLQIVLVGQPELREMLARPGLEQLAQRVIARYHLEPLAVADIAPYLQHRLSVAGLRSASPLGPALARRIHRLSGGVPRRINLLCDRALLGAYAQGRATVDAKTLEQAAREIAGTPVVRGAWPAGRGGRPARVAGLTLAALVLVTVGLVQWRPVVGAVDRMFASNPASPRAAAPPAPATSATTAPDSAPRPDAAGPVPASVAAASASAPLRVAAPLEAEELRRMLRDHGQTEAQAWRSLAARWNVSADDPCDARSPLRCYRGSNGLALVRRLDRPGVIELRDGSDGPSAHVLLVGLDARHAWLAIGAQTRPLPLTELGLWWRGEFATVWRSPPAATEADPAPAAWLAERLGGRTGPGGADVVGPELRGRLVAFQASNGLKADGRPGPLTVMALNRASGVAEPQLSPPN